MFRGYGILAARAVIESMITMLLPAYPMKTYRPPALSLLILLLSGIASMAAVEMNIPAMTWTQRSDWINVKTDPAMKTHAAGDGVTDDTAALQEALNIATTHGSPRVTVYLPPGTYKISSTLYWNNTFTAIQAWNGEYGLWLLGCGRNTTILWTGAAGKPMLLDQGASRSRYEGLVWNAGPANSAAGIGIAHVSLSSYETRIRHENEAFIGFIGISGSATINPPYAYTRVSGVTSGAVPRGATTLRLQTIPAGLVVGAGITGPGIATQQGRFTSTTVMAIDSRLNTITLGTPTARAVPNGVALNFCSSLTGASETVPAAGIFGGCKLETNATAETMIWNCLFRNDTQGTDVAYEVYNNYMWIFKSCEFEHCGIGVNGPAAKTVVLDTHFQGSTVCDISSGLTTRMRRCTSSGSQLFYRNGASGVASMNVFEDCWIDGWTNTDGAIQLNDRTDMAFDCTFTDPPAGAKGAICSRPAVPQDLTLSNNHVSPDAVPVRCPPRARVNVIEIPPGAHSAALTSPRQTFIQQEPITDSRTILDVTKSPYNAARGTDCTTAIQSAITQARKNNNGTIVYIPAGSYGTKATLNVSGGNYTIQGTGWASRIYWMGSAPAIVPIFTVDSPRHIKIEQLQAGITATSGSSTQPAILETATRPGSVTYDEVCSGAYTSSPGIVLNSLPAGSTVFMPLCDSALTVNDCGPAVIFSNYFCSNELYVGGATKPKTGFLATLVMEGGQSVSPADWNIRINDNQDFVAPEYYVESCFNDLLAENANGARWTGRITIQEFKQESQKPSTVIGIQNYAGTIFYGSQNFLNYFCAPVFSQTGTAKVDLDLFGESDAATPIFKLGPSCRLISANNVVPGHPGIYLPDTLPEGWGASAAASLDHLREAGEYDLLLNYHLHAAAKAERAKHRVAAPEQ